MFFKWVLGEESGSHTALLDLALETVIITAGRLPCIEAESAAPVLQTALSVFS